MDGAFSLAGRVAVVTGAGGGLGKAIALALAAHGADVAVTELPGKMDAGRATAGEIGALGRRSHAFPLDVRDLAAVRGMAAETARALGRLDIAVNNAGLNIQRFALDVSEEDWDTVVDTNLKGLFFCAQAEGRHMVEHGGGRIVNIASQMGLVGYYRRAAYCSSKAGVVNLTRVLALEWAKHKVTVNAIAPTFVLTPLTAPMFEDQEFSRDVMSRIPLGTLAEPADVANACVYLASDAAKMITGQTIAVDGGWTAI
ncbi:MAG TPA: glucose 1-dehydrogenase [Candidatus Limnocylindria bacterium]|nr:glucose 1-dehydrogenase [Candidatus Limnocylindria bacterium]